MMVVMILSPSEPNVQGNTEDLLLSLAITV